MENTVCWAETAPSRAATMQWTKIMLRKSLSDAGADIETKYGDYADEEGSKLNTKVHMLLRYAGYDCTGATNGYRVKRKMWIDG